MDYDRQWAEPAVEATIGCNEHSFDFIEGDQSGEARRGEAGV